MTATAFLSISDLKGCIAEVFDELEIEIVSGRIHNAFEANVEGEDVVLLCGTTEHVDALQANEAEVSATYLGTGGAGYPRYLVTSAKALVS